MTQYVTTEFGDRVGFDRYDGGEGAPVVVFVSGAGPFRAIDSITAPTAEALATAGITSIAYDRIGRGDSAVSGAGGDAPITLEREFGAIRVLIEESGAASTGAVLCGHSSGCSISLAAAAAGLPVRGLVLWEAPLKEPGSGTEAWAAEIARRIREGDLEGALVHYMKDMPPQWLEGARRSPMFAGMVAQVGSQQPDAESLAWTDSAPLAERLADITVPVLAVYGEQTQPIMVSAAAALDAALPNAEAKQIPGANHAWEPASMAAELKAFVRALPSR